MAEQAISDAAAPVAAAVTEEMLKGLVDSDERDDPGEGTPQPATTEPAAGAAGAAAAAGSATNPPPAAAGTHADPTPAPAAASTTPSSTPAAPTAEATPAAATSTPAPGTPDKAMQKLQQDLGVALRQQSEIMSRLVSQAPTAADTAAAQRTQRTIDQLRAQIASPDFDANLVESAVLVKSVLEADATAAANAKTLAEINSKLELLAQQSAADKERSANPGIDVQAEWDKAVEAAKPYAKYGGDAWQHRTEELYAQQIATLKATTPPPTPPKPTPAAAAATTTSTPAQAAAATPAASRVGPIVTSGGARLDAPTGAGIAVQQQPSEQQGYEKLLEKLWK